jgi:site-specific DNA-methyltransferase (adenine-specific)
MPRNGAKFNRPKTRVDYLGEGGIFFRADCLDLLTNIRENSIDMAFADPPFNLGKEYDTDSFIDNWETEAYRNWCRAWLLELTRVLRPGGALFLYHWPKWLIDLGAWLNTLPAIEYKSWIALKMKSGFPIKGRLHPAHYGLLYYVKRGAKPTFNLVRHISPVCRHCGKLIRDYGGYRKKFNRFEDENGIPWIQVSDFWEDTRPARQDKARQNQINELPLHIPERAILIATNPGDVVLDCFAGGGSTLHAAQIHGRLWIGGDITDNLSALRRIATFFGTDEAYNLNERLERCFTENFNKSVIKAYSINKKNRSILEAGVIKDVSDSMTQYSIKSKVLGF